MEADSLTKAASVDELVDDQVKVQYILSIDVPEVYQINREEARKLRVRIAKFVFMDEVLYKRGFSQPYLRCLTLDKSHYVMRDVHEGACGNNSRVRSLVHNIVCTGYY